MADNPLSRLPLAGQLGVSVLIAVLLWKPETETVEGLRIPTTLRAAQSARIGVQERLAYTAPATGWYFVEVKMSAPGAGPYTLSYVKT